MNIFLKDLNVGNLLENYKCIVLRPGERAYGAYGTPLSLLIDEPNKRSVPSTRIGDSRNFLKENHLPEYLHDFYPTIDIDIECSTPGVRWSHCYQGSQFLMPGSALEFYVTEMRDAVKLIEAFKSRVPSSFTKLSKGTVSRFLKTLNEDEGFDLSDIVVAPIKYTLFNPGHSWNEKLVPVKYIVFDNKLNPIDVDALLKVLDKIIVDD